MSRRVFISSASGELAPYRKTAIEVCHRFGLAPIAMEEFDPQRAQPAEVCRELVNSADVFVLLLAHRYGSRCPGSELSYTELEYEWAVAREDLPLLAFVVDPAFPWSPQDVDGGPDAEALKRFAARVRQAHLVKPFTSVGMFREELLLALRGHDNAAAAEQLGLPIPTPPEFHAVPQYLGSAPFTGRRADLIVLDEWGRSTDPMMVVEVLGGTGKSALTWEWSSGRAPEVVNQLAGRLWWSFYDGSPSLKRFLQEVLLYTSRQSARAVRRMPLDELTAQAVAALRRRPFLLVLDGFERLLNAYHQFDSSKLKDEEVEPAKRSLIDPQAEDILREMTAAWPSKILISSRLMPGALIGRFGQRMPGVQHVRLPGLTDDDTMILLERLGVGGSRPAVTGFFSRLENHPLLVGVVAGLVRDYRPAPGSFDRWLADPAAGGGLVLPQLDLTQRRTHILAAALDGLSYRSQRVLSWISVLSGTVGWATLEEINPLRLTQLASERHQALRALDLALKDLEERGLLWWDRAANSYDLHPIIRAHAYDRLEDAERVQANRAVRDHFEALPPEDPDNAGSVEDLHQTITIFRALVGGRMTDAADELWMRKLNKPLLVQLGAYSMATELLTPLADRGGTSSRGSLAIAYLLQGRFDEAIAQDGALLIDLLRKGAEPEARFSLLRLSGAYGHIGHLVFAAGLLDLRADLVSARGGDPDSDASLVLHRGVLDLLRGRVDTAHQLLTKASSLVPPEDAPWFAGNLAIHRAEFLLFAHRSLTLGRLDEMDARLPSAQHRMRLAELRLLVLLQQNDFARALVAAENHERLARNAGAETTPAVIAYLNAKLGRVETATAAMEDALGSLRRLHAAVRPQFFVARTLVELNRHAEAAEHAREAYRQAWADGPPNHFFWRLRDAEELLAELGAEPPALPVVDPAAVEIPMAAEVRALLDRTRDR